LSLYELIAVPILLIGPEKGSITNSRYFFFGVLAKVVLATQPYVLEKD
jgi:hypothetical protein